MEIDHEIFYTVILSLPLIQEGQLSVSGERMCANTGEWLRGLSLPKKSVVRKTDRLDMTLWIDWAVKPQLNANVILGVCLYKNILICDMLA